MSSVKYMSSRFSSHKTLISTIPTRIIQLPINSTITSIKTMTSSVEQRSIYSPILKTSSKSNSEHDSDSKITSETPKQVSFNNLSTVDIIPSPFVPIYHQNTRNVKSDSLRRKSRGNPLWYTDRELMRFREEYASDAKAQRWTKRQHMKNRVEVAWRSSQTFLARNNKKKTSTVRRHSSTTQSHKMTLRDGKKNVTLTTN